MAVLAAAFPGATVVPDGATDDLDAKRAAAARWNAAALVDARESERKTRDAERPATAAPAAPAGDGLDPRYTPLDELARRRGAL